MEFATARRVGERVCRAAVVALLPLLTALPSHAQDACPKVAPVKIHEWPGDIINIVPWVAERKGFFRKNCLDAKFVPISSGPAATVGLVNGTIDFSNSSPDNALRARDKGVDVRVVANMYAGHWSALVAGNGLKLTTDAYPALMKELNGKKIGVTALGGSTEAYMRSAFEGATMAPTSATYVAVGGVVTAVPALNGGVVDAAMMFGTGPELAQALGAGKIVLDYRKSGVGPPDLLALHGATLSWIGYGPNIEKNPEMVAAYAKANNEAIAWIQDPKNRAEVYKIVTDKMTLPDGVPNRDETIKRIVDVNVPLLGPGVPKSSIDGWNKYLISLKHLSGAQAYDSAVWKTARQ